MISIRGRRRDRRHAPSLALAVTVTVMLGAPLAGHAAEALRVVKDPVTGELRGPTAAEAAAFAKAEAQLRAGSGTAQAPKAPVEIRYADGTVETKLGDDTMMYSVVRANENGSLAMDCLPAAQARAFVGNRAKAATTKSAAKDHRHE